MAGQSYQRSKGASTPTSKAPAASSGGGRAGLLGNQAMVARMGGQPESAAAQPEGGWMDMIKSWFGEEAAPKKQPEGPGDKDPMLDATKNPETESEHVKGASYEKVEGTAFVQGKGDDKDIDANDVSQGQLGDCYFMAALAAMAKHSPETIRKMITDHKDGTYTVHFHEGGDVVVDSQFAKKDGAVQFAGEGDQDEKQGTELWVMLIEKAWAKLKGGYEDIRGSKVKMSSEDAMEAMSGKGTKTLYPSGMKDEDLLTALGDAMTKGWPATLGVKNLTDKAEIDACKKAGLVPNHAFAIMGVDANAKTVQAYNPWGKEYKVPDLSMDVLKKYVSSIHINKD